MDLGLRGDVALVTGAAGRLGRAICAALGREGAQVAVADRRGEAAADVARSLQTAGCRAHPVEADVSDPAGVQSMLQQVTQVLGPVVFLAGRNNPWITGSILPVTGGSHCRRTHVPLSRGLR